MQTQTDVFIAANGKAAPLIGPSVDRADGVLKVTGKATYAAEFRPPHLAYAHLVESTISKGRLKQIDTTAAQRAPGVVSVLTYHNANKLKLPFKRPGGASQSPGLNLMLQDDRIHFRGQYIAVVVAETLEQATYAASLIRTEYEVEPSETDLSVHLEHARVPEAKILGEHPPEKTQGKPHEAHAQASHKIDQTYTTPTENHNPMEMHATVAQWRGDHLTLYDSSQYVSGVQRAVAEGLGIPRDHIHVITKFVGGGFGCKGATWPHVTLAALAAAHANRPVRVELTRAQMFTSVGRRSQTVQRIALASDADGKLASIIHECTNQCSTYDMFIEPCTMPTRMLYACDNVHVAQKIVRLDTINPTYQRAPGEAPGLAALECAVDELAYKLRMDPLAFRLKNYAEEDPGQHRPWSSKSLRQCYATAAARFGWAKRPLEPRSMRSKTNRYELLGWGMATATYPMNIMPATARVSVHADGTATVKSGTQDLGTGTYTVIAQVVAEELGLPVDKVTCDIGDTRYPQAGVSGGSSTAASVGSASRLAAGKVREKLMHLAVADPRSPLHGLAATHLLVENGRMFDRDNHTRGETYRALLSRHQKKEVAEEARYEKSPDEKTYSMHAFGAVFTEVAVDDALGTVRVQRVDAAYAAGRILNAKTARSQYIGGLVWGISMALFEDTVTDHRDGKIVNNNLADYLVPVNADIPAIHVDFVPEEDPHVNAIGVKGIGEIGITGAPAAVANAIFHATGKRVRDFPITPDTLL